MLILHPWPWYVFAFYLVPSNDNFVCFWVSSIVTWRYLWMLPRRSRKKNQKNKWQQSTQKANSFFVFVMVTTKTMVSLYSLQMRNPPSEWKENDFSFKNECLSGYIFRYWHIIKENRTNYLQFLVWIHHLLYLGRHHHLARLSGEQKITRFYIESCDITKLSTPSYHTCSRTYNSP